MSFDNPWLRSYFPIWLRKHEEQLSKIIEDLGGLHRLVVQDGKPLAAVLSIDEVILSSCCKGAHEPSGFRVADFLLENGVTTPLLPGARRFLEVLRGYYGYKIFLVSERLEGRREETVRVLEALGLCGEFVPRRLEPGEKPTHFVFDSADLRDPAGSLRMRVPGGLKTSVWEFKEAQRADIEKHYTILLNVGGQACDLGSHARMQYWLPHPFYTIH